MPLYGLANDGYGLLPLQQLCSYRFCEGDSLFGVPLLISLHSRYEHNQRALHEDKLNL